jgi:hypothetical protein
MRASSLLSECSLAVGVCEDSVRDASEWSNLLYNDVVIIPADVRVMLLIFYDGGFTL